MVYVSFRVYRTSPEFLPLLEALLDVALEGLSKFVPEFQGRT
jgi:hypothetical protein